MPRDHSDADAAARAATKRARKAAANRLSLSDVLSMVLARRSGASSSVSLTRNARGLTQVAVTVATGEREQDPQTAQEAAEQARELYDALCEQYPPEPPSPPTPPAASSE